ncbi:MAG: hypothetical protein EHM15_13155, partial [Desulfobacteraceae bacterium]
MVKQLIISPAEVRRPETIELGTIPVNQYRRSLADELPVFAGGRLQPQRKKPQRNEPRRDDVVRRPPRSWDEPDGRPESKAGGTGSRAGSGQATGSGRRRGKKGRRPGAG